ncbi:MAG: DUF2933 domain-containing protein [Betaproteobacteria bacterium]|nr:DUF2933 domain-containing protein [Betaproteobacteria bacterium]
MNPHDSSHSAHPAPASPSRTRAWKSAAVMLGLILAFYFLREHWGHVLGLLPYLILLACPLMHLFGHSHQGHSHDASQNGRKSP